MKFHNYILRQITSKRGFLFSITDQGIVSLSNFLTVSLTAKILTPDEFGLFSLFFSGLYMISGSQNSLITGPLRVLGVRNNANSSLGIFKAHINIQFLFGAFLASLAVVVTVFFYPQVSYEIVISFALALFFFQLNELCRVINLVSFDFKTLLTSDLFNHCSRIVLIVILLYISLTTVKDTLLIIAITAAIGSIICITKKNIINVESESIKKIVYDNWRFGKWLLIENLSFVVSIQLCLYFIALWIDKISAGVFNAIQNMLTVVNVIIIGTMSYVIPLARKKLLLHGYNAWKKILFKVGFSLSLITSITVLIISIFSKNLLSFLYTPFYTKFYFVTYILSFYYIVYAINYVLSATFQTAELPQIGFKAKFISAIITVITAYPIIKYGGIYGAAYSLLQSQLVWTIVYVIYILKGYVNKSALESKFADNVPTII